MNMILTLATGGLNAGDIEPFFSSLRLSGCQDPVVVFASGISQETRQMMLGYQATVIDFEYQGMPFVVWPRRARFREALKVIGRYYLRRHSDKKDYSFTMITNARFFYWRDYLVHLKEKPDYVLLTDMRDVVFQANPFSFPFKPGLTVAAQGNKNGQSQGAIKGLTLSVGLLKTLQLWGHDVMCGGTIVADYETGTECLAMLTAMLRRKFFWSLVDGIDQPCLTYLVHEKKIGRIHVYQNWHGPFLTMGVLTPSAENKNPEGYLCNRDGSVIPIVHQYDRIKNLYLRGEPVPACWSFLTNARGAGGQI